MGTEARRPYRRQGPVCMRDGFENLAGGLSSRDRAWRGSWSCPEPACLERQPIWPQPSQSGSLPTWQQKIPILGIAAGPQIMVASWNRGPYREPPRVPRDYHLVSPGMVADGVRAGRWVRPPWFTHMGRHRTRCRLRKNSAEGTHERSRPGHGLLSPAPCTTKAISNPSSETRKF